ncbi:hypothetical protein B0H12DRAFT_1242753 [Mycena haematopus]|nr:hypothetical protein B0H12DRAFT_1242753 [Mycena haematopus]
MSTFYLLLPEAAEPHFGHDGRHRAHPLPGFPELAHEPAGGHHPHEHRRISYSRAQTVRAHTEVDVQIVPPSSVRACAPTTMDMCRGIVCGGARASRTPLLDTHELGVHSAFGDMSCFRSTRESTPVRSAHGVMHHEQRIDRLEPVRDARYAAVHAKVEPDLQ